MAKAKVFIIQDDGNRDFSDAQRFGELVPMVAGGVFPDDSNERVDSALGIMGSLLQGFDPHRDYLLLTGDPALIIMAGLLVGSAHTLVPIQCLKYDRESRAYYKITI